MKSLIQLVSEYGHAQKVFGRLDEHADSLDDADAVDTRRKLRRQDKRVRELYAKICDVMGVELRGEA